MIVLAIHTLNEASRIAKCLRDNAPGFDAVCIGDMGSTDSTVTVAWDVLDELGLPGNTYRLEPGSCVEERHQEFYDAVDDDYQPDWTVRIDADERISDVD